MAIARECARAGKRILIVNMHPFVRLSVTFKPLGNVIIADGSLANFERALNPRTISMPLSERRTPSVVLHPSAQWVQVVPTCFISQGRVL